MKPKKKVAKPKTKPLPPLSYFRKELLEIIKNDMSLIPQFVDKIPKKYLKAHDDDKEYQKQWQEAYQVDIRHLLAILEVHGLLLVPKDIQASYKKYLLDKIDCLTKTKG